jgi:phage-related protein
LGDNEKHSNPKKFGDLGDGLYEFKSFQIRMPFAYAKDERGLILITHGFWKKRDKAPPSEIARARRILKEDAETSKIVVITDQKTKRKRP